MAPFYGWGSTPQQPALLTLAMLAFLLMFTPRIICLLCGHNKQHETNLSAEKRNIFLLSLSI